MYNLYRYKLVIHYGMQTLIYLSDTYHTDTTREWNTHKFQNIYKYKLSIVDGIT